MLEIGCVSQEGPLTEIDQSLPELVYIRTYVNSLYIYVQARARADLLKFNMHACKQKVTIAIHLPQMVRTYIPVYIIMSSGYESDKVILYVVQCDFHAIH